MITIKEAIEAAKKYVLDVYASENLQELRLEEVERSEDNRYWMITFGFRAIAEISSSTWRRHNFDLYPNDRGLFLQWPRDYRVVKVDTNTGEVASVKMRVA